MADKKDIKQDANGYYIPERKEIRLKKCTRCKVLKPEADFRMRTVALAKMCARCCDVMVEYKRQKKLKQLVYEMKAPAIALQDAKEEADKLYGPDPV